MWAVAGTLAACSSDPTADANEVCDCMRKTANENPVSDASAECAMMGMKYIGKHRDNKEKLTEYLETIAACKKEMDRK